MRLLPLALAAREPVLPVAIGTVLLLGGAGDEHAATLPVEPGRGTLVDMLGGKTERSWKTGGLKVTISQSPQYLLLERN